MLKTKYESIVNVQSIGKEENPLKMNDLLRMANEEQMTPATKNLEKIMFVGIDYQQDFMPNGALGVQNSEKDVENATRFIYNNMDKISTIAVTIDTHNPMQIFHPVWWIDENGNNPPPFTAITLADLNSGKWRAVVDPIGSREYVENLEKLAKKTLMIWTYHCLQGTSGCALENQFANMIYFHSVAKKTIVSRTVKGTDFMSEMYGAFKPEYDKKNYINIDFLNKIEKYDKIICAGEAADFCVLETIKQMVDYYHDRPEVTKKIYVLEDCMSPVATYPTQELENLKKKYKINIVKSTDLVL